MTLKTIAPREAARLLQQGAVLVDIRNADEHAREKIAGARHIPLSALDEANLAADTGRPVIFHCKSGARSLGNADRLAEKAGACEAYLLEGGLEAWRKAGLPVATDRSQPLELQRQVQIAAGSLVLIGAALGWLASPGFHALSAFVGAGLVFAGISGFCGMAQLLMRAPWNRTANGRTVPAEPA